MEATIGQAVEALSLATANATPTTESATHFDKPVIGGNDLCRIIAEARLSRCYHSGSGGFTGEPLSDDQVVQEVSRRLDRDGFAPVAAERIIKALRFVEDVRTRRQRERALETFRNAVGPRYAECTLETFKLTHPIQRKVLDAIHNYGDHIAERVAAGANVILFGPSGTGKDHLLCGLAYLAIMGDVEVVWRNGRDIFGRFRDAMDDHEGSERDLLKPLWSPTVLAISDPLPPSGPLTPYQQDILYRVVDMRYRLRRPVWVTLNVRDGAEADERIGVAIVDRLRHGALALACNWPSYRKPLGSEE